MVRPLLLKRMASTAALAIVAVLALAPHTTAAGATGSQASVPPGFVGVVVGAPLFPNTDVSIDLDSATVEITNPLPGYKPLIGDQLIALGPQPAIPPAPKNNQASNDSSSSR